MNQSPSYQTQDRRVFNTSLGPVRPNVTQNLLNNGPDRDEVLDQIDSKFDHNYVWYNLWLYLMILASVIAIFYLAGSTYNAWKFDQGFQSKLLNLSLLAFTIWVFLQFIIEKWAIFDRDLSKANLALIMITINSIIFLGLNAYAGYSLSEFNAHLPEPSESTSFTRALLRFFWIITSILSVTNVLFTNIPAIKVRNDLKQREVVRSSFDTSLVI